MQLHDPSPQGPLGSIHGRGPQVQQQPCHAHTLPNAPPTHPHQEPTASPRVPPTPQCTPPPRVHPTMISPRVPGLLPTYSPSGVQKNLVPPDLSGEGPRQKIEEVPISCQIKPHEPSSSLKKLHWSQQIADLGILDDKVDQLDGPARNTRSQAQVQMLTQEAMLACICTYGEVMGCPIMAHHTAQ
jgi:hypothetical protein